MVYKVGSTVVVDASGNVPFDRISNFPGLVTAGASFSLGAVQYVTEGPGPNYTAYVRTGWVFIGTQYCNVYTRTTT
jgi:hypothetical protein